jgi:hypothetical protein
MAAADGSKTRGLSRRRALGLATAAGAAVLGGAALLRAPGPSAAAARPGGRAVEAPTDFLYLSILAGSITGSQGWPRYVPADFAVPAHALVQVEVRCFDNGPSSVPAGYERVQGTVGGVMTVFPGPDPAPDARGRTVAALAPNGIAHTLTMATQGLSVPIPPLSTVRFLLRTGAPGTIPWECVASCGTGSSGWNGPMSAAGWMQGQMHVLA